MASIKAELSEYQKNILKEFWDIGLSPQEYINVLFNVDEAIKKDIKLKKKERKPIPIRSRFEILDL